MLPIKSLHRGTQETNKENQNSWRTYPSQLDTNPDRGVNRKNGRMKRTKRKVARHRRNRTKKNVSKIDRSRCRLVSASSLRLTQHSSTTTRAILASRLGLPPHPFKNDRPNVALRIRFYRRDRRHANSTLEYLFELEAWPVTRAAKVDGSTQVTILATHTHTHVQNENEGEGGKFVSRTVATRTRERKKQKVVFRMTEAGHTHTHTVMILKLTKQKIKWNKKRCWALIFTPKQTVKSLCDSVNAKFFVEKKGCRRTGDFGLAGCRWPGETKNGSGLCCYIDGKLLKS